MSQSPQWLVSWVRSTQALAQTVSVHWATQTPFWQNCPTEQTVPHVPQL